MAAPRRVARLQQLIHEVAAETVQKELRDPRLAFVTITRAKLSPDLAEAVVYWSALGTDKQRLATARALSKAAGIVQSIVGRAIGTRTTPHLTFRYDETLRDAGHLEEIFEKLKRERGENALGDDAAEAPEKDADDEE
jgi:ribosome-binding factor A